MEYSMNLARDIKIMKFVVGRLKEPSTHAALTGLFAAFGNISDSTWNIVMNGLAVTFAVAGVFIKEPGAED